MKAPEHLPSPRPRMVVHLLGWGVLAALVGGGWFGAQHLLARTRQTMMATDAPRIQEMTRLREEIRRLEDDQRKRSVSLAARETAAKAEAEPVPAQDTVYLEAMRTLSGLLASKAINITNPRFAGLGNTPVSDVLTPNVAGELPDSFASLFHLGPAEFAELQETLASTRQRVGELRTAATTVRRDPETIAPLIANMSILTQDPNLTADYVAIIEVAPIPGAAELRDRLKAVFQQTLGKERFDIYLALSANAIDKYFDSFGVPGMTFTVARGSDGKYAYIKKPLNAQYAEMTSTNIDPAKMPEQLGVLARFLPADL